MLNLGLSAVDQLEFHALLLRSHRIRIRLEVLDLNHVFLYDISDTLLGGDVTIDVGGAIQRQAKLNLLDIGSTLNLDPNDPNNGVAFPTRMVRIHYCVGRDDMTKWYEVPIFTGPVTKVDRDGAVLNLECSGKEVLADSALWIARNYGPGWNRNSLVVNLMRTVGGEQFFDMVATASKNASAAAVARNSTSAWGWARVLLNNIGLQVFYDGRGYFRSRVRPGSAVWVFDSKSCLDDPQNGYDLSNLINAVEISGATPKGHKAPITYKTVAPATHPLSPQELGRGNPKVPRYFPFIESNTELKTLAQCKARGDQVLRDGLLEAVDVAVPTAVVPHIEEDDYITYRTSSYNDNARLKKCTIPLIATSPMSVGYTLSVKPTKIVNRLRRP